MNSRISEFRSRNAEVFGVSMDSVHTLKAYAESMGGLNYPLLADWNPHGAVAENLGIRLPDGGCPSRTTVVIDAQGVIRDMHTNPLGEDRDFSETLKQLDGLK